MKAHMKVYLPISMARGSTQATMTRGHALMDMQVATEVFTPVVGAASFAAGTEATSGEAEVAVQRSAAVGEEITTTSPWTTWVPIVEATDSLSPTTMVTTRAATHNHSISKVPGTVATACHLRKVRAVGVATVLGVAAKS